MVNFYKIIKKIEIIEKSGKNNDEIYEKLSEFLFSKEIKNTLETLIFILLKAHFSKKFTDTEIFEILQKITNLQTFDFDNENEAKLSIEKPILLKTTKFLENMLKYGISENKFDFIEKILEISKFYQNSQCRKMRFLIVDLDCVLGQQISQQIIIKSNEILHLNELDKKSVKIKEITKNVDNLGKLMKFIFVEIIEARKCDVIFEIKKEILNCVSNIFAKIQENQEFTEFLLENIKILKIIRLFLYEKNNSLKIQAILIYQNLFAKNCKLISKFPILLNEINDQFIIKLVLFSYNNCTLLAINALKLICKIYKCEFSYKIPANSLKYAMNLILNENHKISLEAAKLWINFMQNSENFVNYIEVLQEFISQFEPKLKTKMLEKAIFSLNLVNPNLFTITKISEILRDENEKTAKTLLDSCSLLFKILIKIHIKQSHEFSEIETTQIIKIIRFLLDLDKYEERVENYIKSLKYIIEPTLENETILVNLSNKITEIFIETNYKNVILSCAKMLNYYKNAEITQNLYMGIFGKAKNIRKFNEIYLQKISIACCFCEINEILYFYNEIYENFKISVTNFQENYNEIIIEAFFNIFANLFEKLCKSNDFANLAEFYEIYKKFSNDLINLFLSIIKKFQPLENSQNKFSIKAYILLSKILSLTNNEIIKTKYSKLFIEIDEFIIDSISNFLISIYKLNKTFSQNILEITELLLISSPQIFNSKLILLYLSIFIECGPKKRKNDFIQKIKIKCGNDNKILLKLLKGAIFYCIEISNNFYQRIENILNIIIWNLEINNEIFYQFLLDLLQIFLKSELNFKLLETLKILINRNIFTENQIMKFSQKYENYFKQIIKSKFANFQEINENNKEILKNFHKYLTTKYKASKMPKISIPNLNEELTKIEEIYNDEGTLIQFKK